MGLVVLVSPRVRPTIFLPPKNDIPGISIPERNPKPSTYWVAAAAPAAMELHVPPFDYNKPWKRSIDFCGKTLHRERERDVERKETFFCGVRNQMDDWRKANFILYSSECSAAAAVFLCRLT